MTSATMNMTSSAPTGTALPSAATYGDFNGLRVSTASYMQASPPSPTALTVDTLRSNLGSQIQALEKSTGIADHVESRTGNISPQLQSWVMRTEDTLRTAGQGFVGTDTQGQNMVNQIVQEAQNQAAPTAPSRMLPGIKPF